MKQTQAWVPIGMHSFELVCYIKIKWRFNVKINSQEYSCNDPTVFIGLLKNFKFPNFVLKNILKHKNEFIS